MVVKVNGALKVEGTDYTKELVGDKVHISFISAINKDDVATVSGICATSGVHAGSVVNGSNTTWQ